MKNILQIQLRSPSLKKILTVSTIVNTHIYAKDNSITALQNNNTQITSQLYETLLHEKNKALLPSLLTKMPLGGDLHHHYSGSIYAETYLDWVAKQGWFIDSYTLHIVKVKVQGKCKLLTPSQLMANAGLYGKLLSTWSDKDFHNHYHEQPAPDANFFNTFSYFEPIAYDYIGLGLNILKQRA